MYAHYNLASLHSLLGDQEEAARHAALHLRYKPDDTARGRAVRLARQRYPAANAAAEGLVIYDLNRPDAWDARAEGADRSPVFRTGADQ